MLYKLLFIGLFIFTYIIAIPFYLVISIVNYFKFLSPNNILNITVIDNFLKEIKNL